MSVPHCVHENNPSFLPSPYRRRRKQIIKARPHLPRDLASAPGRLTTVLLTEGRLEEATAQLPPNTPVYPAPPALFARFPVASVPARLSRAGDQLRIDLIPEADLK